MMDCQFFRKISGQQAQKKHKNIQKILRDKKKLTNNHKMQSQNT